jgi:hypothetical protein
MLENCENQQDCTNSNKIRANFLTHSISHYSECRDQWSYAMYIPDHSNTKGAKQPKRNWIEKLYKFSFSWISKHHRTQIKIVEEHKMGPKQNLGAFLFFFESGKEEKNVFPHNSCGNATRNLSFFLWKPIDYIVFNLV